MSKTDCVRSIRESDVRRKECDSLLRVYLDDERKSRLTPVRQRFGRVETGETYTWSHYWTRGFDGGLTTHWKESSRVESSQVRVRDEEIRGGDDAAGLNEEVGFMIKRLSFGAEDQRNET